MKKPFDFLLSDKEPFLYIERARISKVGGNLVYEDKAGVKQVPVAAVASIFMGPGTSITRDASELCAQHDCYIVMSNGYCNIHSIWHTGRYSSPEWLAKQAKIFSTPKLKLTAAKLLVSNKLCRSGQILQSRQVSKAKTIEEILGIEAAAARAKYKELASGNSFKREFINGGVNGNISLLNNMLYNYITLIILHLGLSPSMGFVHGTTRRGGLVFDIADIFKYEMCLLPSFLNKDKTGKQLMFDLSQKIKQGRHAFTKEVIAKIKEVLEIASSSKT